MHIIFIQWLLKKINQFSTWKKFAVNSTKHAKRFKKTLQNLNNQKKHEIRSKINHIAPNTKSYQLIKCILSENSKAVYQGKIFVDSKAQKTNGYQ